MEMILSSASIEQFLKSLSERGRSGNTVRAYENDLNGLLRWTRTSGAGSSTFEKQCAAYLNQTRATASPKTTKRRLATFRQFGKFHNRLVLVDYRPPTPAKPTPHPISEGVNGIHAMIEHAKKKWQAALVAGIGLLGMRVSEARTLTCDSFDLSRGMDGLSVTVVGKGDKRRTIPVGAAAWKAIEPAYIEAAASLSRRLVPVSDRTARQAFKDLGKAAGLTRDVASHDGRATLATHALNSGANIRVVQEILGHASVETTQLYTGVEMDQMREAIKL